LVNAVTGLADRGIGVCSLQEAIDTTTPGGKLVFHVFAALAEFERNLIRERTTAGLAAAQARGRHGSCIGDDRAQAAGGAGDVSLWAVHGGRHCHHPWGKPGLDRSAPYRRQSLTQLVRTEDRVMEMKPCAR
jgi:hypothetical protein